MSKEKILITSALPYVNNVPHLGNIIGCVLPADVISRYFKSTGEEVLYICGADEYGTCTEIKAKQEGLTPKEICDKYIEIHKKIYKWFQIDFDYFGRTSTPNPKEDDWQHTKISQGIFRKLAENGYLIEIESTQLFCVELNKYLADRFVVGTCPKCKYEKATGDQCDKCNTLHNASDLINPTYKLNSDYKLEVRKTEHLYLDLPKLEPKLKEWFNKQKENWSSNAINITETWFKEGLKPRCVTRDLEWGTPVPDTEKFGSKYSNKVMYNWFDAPIGYLSITANHTGNWEDWWKNPEKVRLIQTMSKDNVVFHSIIFIASLMGTGEEYTLVDNLASCEYLNYQGGKFSKSNKIGVFGDDAMNTNISSDIWRFYLLFKRPETKDTEFSWGDLQAKVNGILNDNLGNMIHRVLHFTHKKYDIVPVLENIETFETPHNDFILEVSKASREYQGFMSELKLKNALHKIIYISDISNKYLVNVEPWKLFKTDKKTCDISICIMIHVVGLLSRLLYPFMPMASKKISDILNYEYDINYLKFNLITGKVNKPEILFNKIEDNEIEEYKTTC